VRFVETNGIVFRQVCISHATLVTDLQQGDPSDAYFVILAGAVSLAKTMPPELKKVSTGEGFGEGEVVRALPRFVWVARRCGLTIFW